MTAEDSPATSSFSTKEMIVRVEAKIDTVLAQQQSFAVDLAQTKTRLTAVETEMKANDIRLSSDMVLLRREQDRHSRRLSYAAGATAALILVANLTVALVHGF